VSARTREVEPVRTKERGQFFAFEQTSFMNFGLFQFQNALIISLYHITCYGIITAIFCRTLRYGNVQISYGNVQISYDGFWAIL